MDAELSSTTAAYGHACTNCSKAKTRCVLRTPGSTCERCHRLGKHCAPSVGVRKRRSKASGPQTSRAKLEEKLDDLVALIRSQSSQKSADADTALHAEGPPKQSASAHPWLSPFATRKLRMPLANSTGEVSQASHGDIVLGNQFLDPNTLTPAASNDSLSDNTAALHGPPDGVSPDSADEALHIFRTTYLKFHPYIHIPEETSAQQLQDQRPFLWLVISAICSRSAETTNMLSLQIRETLAREVIVNCERSIDLLLGLLTYLGWAVTFSKGKPYISMLTNMAASLASDLNLHRAPTEDSVWKRCNFPRPLHLPENSSARTNEGRRALLGCFLNSTIVSTYKRAEVTRWRPHLEEAFKKLMDDGETPQDTVLVALARIMCVVDEASQLSQRPEDPERAHPPMFHIPALEESLNQVKNSLPLEVLEQDLVKIYLHGAEIFIYSLALEVPGGRRRNHRGRRPPQLQHDAALVQARRREHLWSCVAAARAFLDAFMDTTHEANLPALTVPLILQYGHAIHVIYRLVQLGSGGGGGGGGGGDGNNDAPAGWDRTAVRATIDMPAYLDRTAAKMDRAHAIDGAAQQHGGMYARLAVSMRAMKGAWLAGAGSGGGGAGGGDVPAMEMPATQGNGEWGGDSAELRGEGAAGEGGGGGFGANGQTDMSMFMNFEDDTWLTEFLASWDASS